MHNRYVVYFGLALIALIILRGYGIPAAQAVSAAQAPPAPPFTHREADAWINSPPLDWNALRGRVVLVDFWTYACWNCYRSFPWLHSVEQRFGPQGLRVIGVHTPEFEHEHVRAHVERKVKEFKLTHPVMLDNDHSYWNALGNRYWPAFYLVDRRGRVRAVFAGETHAGDANARNIESAIKELLAEPG